MFLFVIHEDIFKCIWRFKSHAYKSLTILKLLPLINKIPNNCIAIIMSCFLLPVDAHGKTGLMDPASHK